jgi:hypothetical protein
MTRKSLIIQQSKVTELMSQLANLPEREKAPGDPVSLSEIFRAKEYITEIKGALKRGYSFDDLAKIFTERCGVAVSARQIRYHFTRGQNRGRKSKSGKKNGESVTPKGGASSTDSLRGDAAEEAKRTLATTDFETGSETISPSKDSGFASDNGAVKDAKPEAFSSR